MSEKTIFQRIIDREIPAEIVFEDEHCVVIRDINPQAPTHLLLVPKQLIESVDALQASDQILMGHLWLVVRQVAAELGLDQGYRVVVNCGPQAGQEVPHLHFHILAGRGFRWPPG
jgi:histidine triad (HIT) family protein